MQSYRQPVDQVSLHRKRVLNTTNIVDDRKFYILDTKEKSEICLSEKEFSYGYNLFEVQGI